MNSSLTAYTPLETLLLFHSLASYGVESPAFSRISDLLKKNPHIRNAHNFDVGRLSPDALRELYLRLLKDEERSEIQDSQARDGDGLNGEHQTPSRKRKAPSPTLPTVQEASKHAHLIPKMVAKLYARYRTYAIDHIREEERKWDRLQKELAEVKRGERDGRLKGDANGASSTAEEDLANAVSPRPSLEPPRAPLAESATASPVPRALAPNLDPQSQRPPQTSVEALINPVPNGQVNGTPPLAVRPSASPSTAQDRWGRSPHAISHNRTPSGSQATGLPAPDRRSSTGPHQSPYPATQPPPLQPSASPKLPDVASPNRGNASPVILPPPPGMPFPAPIQSPSAQGHPQTGPLHQFSPSTQRHPILPQLSPALPAGSGPPHRGYYQPPYAAPPGPYTPSPSQQPPHTYYQPPHQGGYMLPPFQVTPQDPTRTASAQQRASQQPPPGPVSRGQTSASPIAPHSQQHAQSAPSRQQLPPVTPAGRSAARPPPLTIPPLSSETRWKQSRGVAPPSPLRSPTVSPIDDVTPALPGSKPAPASRRGNRRQATSPDTPQETTSADTETRPMRAGRNKSKRARGGSAAPSAATLSARGRTRSQSVVSHADEAINETESIAGRSVKHEPSTPATMTGDEPTLPTSGRSTRRRPGLPQSQPSQQPKRKRGGTLETVEPMDDAPTPTSAPGSHFIVARGAFPKVSAPLMHDILSHKHASLFSQPVKEKDAEGYSDIIKRPQDLKSIKTAINSGAKAIANMSVSEGAGGAGSPGGTGNVALPVHPDIVPPKGIVNSAQLERELMRMFANAVMFNSGEEGVVEDAREMFESVQEAVSNWRHAERTTEGRAPAPGASGIGRRAVEDDVDELAPDAGDAEEEAGRGKRRKL